MSEEFHDLGLASLQDHRPDHPPHQPNGSYLWFESMEDGRLAVNQRNTAANKLKPEANSKNRREANPSRSSRCAPGNFPETGVGVELAPVFA